MSFLKSKKLESIPWIKHGFGHRSLPKREDAVWKNHRPQWKQIHSTICKNTHSFSEDLGETDGIFTGTKNLPIGVLTADCVPILLCHQKIPHVGALHSGWRGTLENIVQSGASKLEPDFSQYIAVLGPSIRACCYEVSEEIIQLFESKYPEILKKEMEPSPRHLSLQSVIQFQLKKVGIQSIEDMNSCTLCSTDFYSYRRNQESGRQVSWIEIV